MSNPLGRPTSSEIRSTYSFSQSMNIEALDLAAERAAVLAWSEPADQVVISGSTDVTLLTEIRGAILALKNDLFGRDSQIVISGGGREGVDRRLLLLEKEIDGLLKRKINYSVQGEAGRVLDYTGILNEKEYQVVELEKKIQNLEERLRRATKYQNELEDEVVRLKRVITATSNANFNRAEWEKLTVGAVEFHNLNERFEKLRAQYGSLGGLLKTQFATLRQSGVRLDHETNINQLLNAEGVDIAVVNGIANITSYHDRVVEVPTQDARTKHLIHLLARQLKTFVGKYPKLRAEFEDNRLIEFFQQEVID
jgi:hypothetical protein